MVGPGGPCSAGNCEPASPNSRCLAPTRGSACQVSCSSSAHKVHCCFAPSCNRTTTLHARFGQPSKPCTYGSCVMSSSRPSDAYAALGRPEESRDQLPNHSLPAHGTHRNADVGPAPQAQRPKSPDVAGTGPAGGAAACRRDPEMSGGGGRRAQLLGGD